MPARGGAMEVGKSVYGTSANSSEAPSRNKPPKSKHSFNDKFSKLEKEASECCDKIIANPGDLWERRVDALRSLTELFERQPEFAQNNPDVWTPRLMQTILFIPLEEQVKDLRSNITAEVGATLVALAGAARDASSDFFLKLLPAISLTLNSGVRVISNHMNTAMKELLPLVRIKKGCAWICREANSTKSSQLREILVSYIPLMLDYWGKVYLKKEADVLKDTLGRALKDASSGVRASARAAFVPFNRLFPELANRIYDQQDGRTQSALTDAVKQALPPPPPSLAQAPPQASADSSSADSPSTGAVEAATAPIETTKVNSNGSDVATLAPLVDAYRAWYEFAFRGNETALSKVVSVDSEVLFGWLEAPASKETPTFLKARLKQGEAVAFLAHHKKSAVGFALAYPSFDTLSLEPCWQLDALWVAPSSRRIRVGTALLVAVGAGAKAAGVRAVIVHPNKGSDDAHDFFEKCGYAQDTSQRQITLKVK